MEKLTASRKIERAKVALYLDAPFWASICLRLDFIEDKSGAVCQTMATDGKSIYYYPPFVDKLTFDECKGVLAHEVGHVILLHPFRRQSREIRKYNIACDYALNPILIEAGFKLPKGFLENPNFHDHETEWIYNQLPSDPQGTQGQGTGNDPGGTGGVIDYPGTPTQTKTAELEQKMVNVQSAQIAKQAGTLPESLDRLIEELTEPKLNWKEFLAQFVDSRSRNDFTWTTPNRRYLSMGYYLPSLISPELGEITCLIDASGSVTESELKDLVSELKGITDLYEQTTLHLIFFDTKASKVFIVTDETDLKGLKIPRMGGGTNYRPAFEKVTKEGLTPKAIIVLTDGQCSQFPSKYDVPTLWVINSKETYKRFSPPFGDKIYMEEQEQ